MLYPKRTRGAIGDNWVIGGIALVVIVGSLGYIILGGSGGQPEPKGPWYFKCVNEECGHEIVVDDFDEYKDMLPEPDPNDLEAGPGEVLKLTCPECGKETLYPAEKCPDHGIYVPTINTHPYHPRAGDVCPVEGCDYSPSAERAKKWREKNKDK